MNIGIRMSFIILVIGFVIGTIMTGHYFADHPDHLLDYVWPTLEARILVTNPFTAEWIVHFQGQRVTASQLVAAWMSQNPSAYRQLLGLFTKAPLGGLVTGMLLLGFFLYLDEGLGHSRHIRGRHLASRSAVTKAARRLYGRGLIKLGGVILPLWLEVQGLLLVGATGKGKTNAIMAVLDGAATRGDRAIVVTENGALMGHYMISKPLVLNPFDERSQDWSLIAEMHGIHDAPRLAKSAIPDAEGADGKPWTTYAQQLLSAALERVYGQGNATNADLLRLFRPEGQADLKSLVRGKSVSTIFMPGNERMAANVTAVLAMHLPAYEYLNPKTGTDGFSITRWIQEWEYGWLWLTYMTDHLDAVRPLTATWLDIASTAATALPPVKRPARPWQFWKTRVAPRRIWNVIDEVASVGKIQSLVSSITLGRKAGLCTVIGMQSISQPMETYGADRTETILGSLNSAVIFGTQAPDTAEYLSKRIGDAEVEITNRGINQSSHQSIRRVVLPSEIEALPDLTAYLVLSGVSGVARIELPYQELLTRIPPFVPKADQPLPPPPPLTPLSSDTTPSSPLGPEFI